MYHNKLSECINKRIVCNLLSFFSTSVNIICLSSPNSPCPCCYHETNLFLICSWDMDVTGKIAHNILSKTAHGQDGLLGHFKEQLKKIGECTYLQTAVYSRKYLLVEGRHKMLE